jgi:multimeric flavodoxin WrbA
MPKLLVLFDSRSDDMTRLADAVAEGARSVRFAEVDVRRTGDAQGAAASPARHRALESADALAAYDGIIIGADVMGAPGSPTLEPFATATASLVNKVGSAFTAPPLAGGRRDALWAMLAPMADRGMILVPPAVTEAPADELESARQQGKRVAEVVGWVTHARSHHHHH